VEQKKTAPKTTVWAKAEFNIDNQMKGYLLHYQNPPFFPPFEKGGSIRLGGSGWVVYRIISFKLNRKEDDRNSNTKNI
jgi:hypothetical protein